MNFFFNRGVVVDLHMEEGLAWFGLVLFFFKKKWKNQQQTKIFNLIFEKEKLKSFFVLWINLKSASQNPKPKIDS